MITQYKNIDEIKSAKKAVQADRFGKLKRDLFAYDAINTYKPLPGITKGDTRVEMHVYSDTSWITGNHKVVAQTKLPQYYDRNKKAVQLNSAIGIDVVNELYDLKITTGNFRIAVNFFSDLIGDYDRQHLRIDEISPDRTEIRLRAIDAEDPDFLQQITYYIQTVDQTADGAHKTYLLNFSRNQCVMFVNSVVIGEYLYVKLFEPLPNQFGVDFKCWVVEELKPTYLDRVSILPKNSGKTYNQLAGPNWQANTSLNNSAEVGYANWTELLGNTLSTSQQIVDTYFSGSLSGIKLNIDYSDFNNFVFYSSATERLANFRYKMELVEYYASQSAFVATLSGSVATTNVNDFDTLKSNLIGTFDAFEQYLYWNSGSYQLTTHDVPLLNANVAELTGSYVKPVPKLYASKPYTCVSVNSTEFKNWYKTTIDSASIYDAANNNILLNAIPEFVRFDENNDNLIAFTNMLGHHYDILYTYVHHMTDINKREENPKVGMPNELLFSVAKQFGWTLANGKQDQDLWEYVLGTNQAGIPLTGSNTVGDPSVSGQEMTYTVWRRIVNNLPLLLKSKGTKRSIRALLACYGIPQSFISINEYGGPRIIRKPVYEKLNFDYALDLINNSSGTVVTTYNANVNSIELRFRTADVVTNPTIPNTMTIFENGSNEVTVDFTSGTIGTMKINGVATGKMELFDGGWTNVLLRENGSNLELFAARSKYGKIVGIVSASVAGSIPTSDIVRIGSGANRLVGQVQELRLWSSSLNLEEFANHTKAPSAYDGNVDAYSELIYRLPLSTKINHATTSSLGGWQPQANNITSLFASWTNNTPYDSLEETYYFDAPSVGGGSYDDNKVRLESNTLTGTLDIKTRAERSQYDKAPLDSNRIGVYFSPQTMIDEDIIAQLGYQDLDQLIGDPGDTDSNSYPELEQFAQRYWKKYESRNDINAYLNMFSLFDLSFFTQLEQLLPARVERVTGVLIQPNLLERNKATILPKVQREDASLNSILHTVSPTASGNMLFLDSKIDGKIATLNAIDDEQIQIYLTASNAKKYDGMVYSNTYLIPSASTWITASSPYWQSEAIPPIIESSVRSEFAFISGTVTYSTSSGGSITPGGSAVYGSGTYGTSTYYIDVTGAGFNGVLASVQSYLPTGQRRMKYDGAKMTSPAFNVDSPHTIDGGPVVEWQATNPNQLIYTENGDQGSFLLQ
jgi:hypothetical protein